MGQKTKPIPKKKKNNNKEISVFLKIKLSVAVKNRFLHFFSPHSTFISAAGIKNKSKRHEKSAVFQSWEIIRVCLFVCVFVCLSVITETITPSSSIDDHYHLPLSQTPDWFFFIRKSSRGKKYVMLRKKQQTTHVHDANFFPLISSLEWSKQSDAASLFRLPRKSDWYFRMIQLIFCFIKVLGMKKSLPIPIWKKMLVYTVDSAYSGHLGAGLKWPQ